VAFVGLASAAFSSNAKLPVRMSAAVSAPAPTAAVPGPVGCGSIGSCFVPVQ
jgi:hypothetical protein